MAKQYMSDQLFEQIYHARLTDPETSHEAVPKNLSGQALQVLKAYRDVGRPMTDMDAYEHAGFERGRLAHQRCSDLRRREFIKWTGGLGTSPSRNSAKLSEITAAGLAYLTRMKQ